MSNKQTNKKSIKEFINYLDMTIQFFKNNLSDDDYDKKSSEINNMLTVIFGLYQKIMSAEPSEQINIMEKNESIIESIQAFTEKKPELLSKPISAKIITTEIQKVGITDILPDIYKKKTSKKNPWENDYKNDIDSDTYKPIIPTNKQNKKKQAEKKEFIYDSSIGQSDNIFTTAKSTNNTYSDNTQNINEKIERLRNILKQK